MTTSKINRGNSGVLAGNFKLEESLAYTLLSTAVGLYSSPLYTEKKADLIRNRMAWVKAFNMDFQYTEICYSFEGFFNCVLGYLLWQKFNNFLYHPETGYGSSLRKLTFFAKPASKKQVNFWQIARICAQILLLFAMYGTNDFPKPGRKIKRSKKEEN